MRDIRDGHITLYVQVQRFDPMTGALVAPREFATTADRMPAGVRLRSAPSWWQMLASEGWLRLPESGEPQIWMLTGHALTVVAEREEAAVDN